MRYIKSFNESFMLPDNYLYKYKDNVSCMDINGVVLKVGDTVKTLPNPDTFELVGVDIEEYNEEIFIIGSIEKCSDRKDLGYIFMDYKGIYKLYVEHSGSWFYNIECEKI